MPLASISNVTSICGTPRGAGGMPMRWNLPSVLLSFAISLSPCMTCTSTEGWLSTAVENIWLFLVGMVVFLTMSFVATPPSVSTPRDRGVTSRRSTSLTSPVSMPAWMAAPTATHSSGLIPFVGCLFRSFLMTFCTAGILVEPPTRRTFAMSFALSFESLMALLVGPMVFCTRSDVRSSNFARVRLTSRCFGPDSSAVI